MQTESDILVIVDDEAPMRSLLRDFFVSQGYKVRTFSSARGAIRALRNLSTAPAAIISDVRMYPLNGIDFLRIAKRDFPGVPVFLFTGDGSPDEKAQALKLGAANYLSKPFSLTGLKELLDASLSSKRSATSSGP